MASRKVSAQSDRYRRTIGERIRVVREACGWSVNDLAERARISVRLVEAIERGTATTMTVVHLLALSDALDLSIVDVMSE